MKKLILLLALAAIIPGIVLANGGDQRVVKNKYLINLSRSPFTPIVGVKTSFLASFVDISENKLINEDIKVNMRISKLGEASNGSFIFEQNNISIKSGVLDFSYTFTDAGLHEIFFDFAFASNPQQIYNAPDFLIDIQRAEIQFQTNQQIIFLITGGIILGFMIGLLSKTRFKTIL